MTVKELIEALSSYDQGLQVRINADHGQTPMRASFIGLINIDEDSYMPEEVEGCGIQVLEIQGY